MCLKLRRRTLDATYNMLHPQDRYKNHGNVGRIFRHPIRQKDIVVVAYKNNKNWWYKYTSSKSFNLFEDSKTEHKSKKKFSWMVKKGLELGEARSFGHHMKDNHDRRYL